MALNKKEQEILNQIEQELLKNDPDLANTVKESTLSKYTRTRAVVSFFIFCIGLLTMFSTYIVLPTISNTKALLNAENINEWNFKQVYTVLRNKDNSRQS
jgi:hypothetical protein